MLSPYKTPPNKTNKRRQNISNTNLDDNSHRERDAKRHQLISIDLKGPQLSSKEVTNENFKSNKSKNKNSLKSGSLHKNIEINGEYLDESFHNNILQMELAMQSFSKDQTVRSNILQDLKAFKSQSVAIQAKKKEND